MKATAVNDEWTIGNSYTANEYDVGQKIWFINHGWVYEGIIDKHESAINKDCYRITCSDKRLGFAVELSDNIYARPEEKELLIDRIQYEINELVGLKERLKLNIEV